MSELVEKQIPAAEGATSPFWSADGKWIGFFVGGLMKKVPADGGPVETICTAQGSGDVEPARSDHLRRVGTRDDGRTGNRECQWWSDQEDHQCGRLA
jgi:hypothetical protein